MRRDRLAEAILSLVAPPDHAAAVVGDLMEDGAARNAFRFWQSVARVAVRRLGRDLVSLFVPMAASAAFSWFLYMGISLVFALVGYVALTLAWGLAYVLSQHTGVDLLTDFLRLRLDWPPLPQWATYALQAVVFFAITPICIGRVSAGHWRGHELALVIIVQVIWLAMSVLVPFVGVGVRAAPMMVPVLVTFVLLGLLSGRVWPRPVSDR